MYNNVQRHTRTAKCSNCTAKIPKGTLYFRTQYYQSTYGPTYGRNFCKSCMWTFFLHLFFPWFYKIPTIGVRNVKAAKAAFRSPYPCDDEVPTHV